MEKAVDLIITPSQSEIKMKLSSDRLHVICLHLIVHSVKLQSAEHLAFPYLGLKWKQD